MTDPSEDRPPQADERPEGGDEPQDSILGSLPRSRPSVRSPRRAAARARRAKPATSKPKARAASPEAKRAARPPKAEPAQEPDAEGTDLEDIARAGVTTAVQVATAGLRFAGRAAGAIRESLERR
jgi:hypothetical protein